MQKIDYYFDIVKGVLEDTFNKKMQGIDIIKKEFIRLKSPLFAGFNDDGMIEMPISGKVRDETVLQSLNNLGMIAQNLAFKDRFYDLESTKIAKALKVFLSEFTFQEIASNRLARNFDEKLKKGTKLSKVIMALDGTPLEKEFMQIVYSDLLSSLKSSGTLTLSINPLDFLLVSNHTTGWKTCHRFYRGQHQTGGLGYLLSPKAVVAHVANKKECVSYNPLSKGNLKIELPIPWALKEWRQMVMFDIHNKYAVLGRHFPSYNDNYFHETARLSAEVLSRICGEEDWCYSNYSTGEGNDPVWDSTHKTYFKGADWVYNDPPVGVTRLKSGNILGATNMEASIFYCPRCGKKRTDGITESLFCEFCGEGFGICCGCGEQIVFSTDDYREDYGDYYCTNCYED